MGWKSQSEETIATENIGESRHLFIRVFRSVEIHSVFLHSFVTNNLCELAYNCYEKVYDKHIEQGGYE
jgi:hypothetical protein